jgi:hypothetical protein
MKYAFLFLPFAFLSLFEKIDRLLRIPCEVDHSWSTSDRCYNRSPRGFPHDLTKLEMHFSFPLHLPLICPNF